MSAIQITALKPMTARQLQEPKSDDGMSEQSGWAALYDTKIDLGLFMSEIAPGAFAQSLGNPEKIIILDSHEHLRPIGKASKFNDNQTGLFMDFLINPDVQYGAEAISNIERQVVTGLSVGFRIDEYVIRVEGEGENRTEIERITRGTLREVSTCAFPAIDGARILSDQPNSVTTCAVVDGEGETRRLQVGDFMRLATFTPATRGVQLSADNMADIRRANAALDRFLSA